VTIAVLFDVDLTLVDAKRSGSKSMRRAFDELWGFPDALEGIPMGGRTDRAIFRDAVAKALGRAPGEEELSGMLVTFEKLYYEYLEAQLGETPAEPCPGIPGVLERVEQQEDLMPGIATGNFVKGAALKLRSAGIDPGRFAFGAYGDESENREEIVALAIERARVSAGGDVTPVVLGDTPLDHGAARANGALSVLVGTGLCAFSELEALGSDFLARSLEDPEPLLAWLASLDA
jgi:phosphoglycolate phosphatase-like HAD superfamily hydrolase